MPDDDNLEVELVAALGARASNSTQQLTLYIPDRDRLGVETGTQRAWVLEGAELLARMGGGVTITPAVEGGWLDPDREAIVWERPVLVYAFVNAGTFAALLPELRGFLHRLGRQTGQGEVLAEFDGAVLRITDFEDV